MRIYIYIYVYIYIYIYIYICRYTYPHLAAVIHDYVCMRYMFASPCYILPVLHMLCYYCIYSCFMLIVMALCLFRDCYICDCSFIFGFIVVMFVLFCLFDLCSVSFYFVMFRVFLFHVSFACFCFNKLLLSN